MNRTLEKNMCKLPDAVINSEIPDLGERAEQYIDSGLQYACKSWHKHLVDEHMACTPEITSALHRFLEEKFVFWLEVLSVLGAAREAVDALDLVTKWLEAPPVLELANDCFRFVTGFFQVIDESAPHIYHSALPVSPQTSMVRKLYERHAVPLTRIAHGLPDSWDPAIVTMEYSRVRIVAWSPCGRFIAISDGGSRAEILDAATLKRLTILESPQGHTRKLVFSQDARLLMSFNAKPEKFISWDFQTGVLVNAISPEQCDDSIDCYSITYSSCGTMFGVLVYRPHGFGSFTICTYDIRSGTHIYSHFVEGRIIPNIWTHGECLRFAVMKSGSITTWEVGFASRNTPIEIESLSLPDNSLRDSYGHWFHPTLSRLAFVHSWRIHVWDAQHSRFLLNEFAWAPDGISFSSDGRFFMYREKRLSHIYLWKESPTGYNLHRKLNCGMATPNQLISPNGESIFIFGGSVLQLWRTTDSSTSFSHKQTDERFIVEFSPDEMLAAVARFKDNTVTVLDLKSGDSLLIINTDIEVYGQGAAGSTIVAVGREKVVTWNLPTRDHVLNMKANVNDSIRTVTISCPRMLSYPYPLEFASISPDLHTIAIVEYTSPFSRYLHLHDVPTKQCLGSVLVDEGRPWFTSDGRQVWYITDRDEVANGLTIVEDSDCGAIKPKRLGPTNQPPNTPWLSSRGYQITDDGWILGISGKRLIWLPPHWRSLDTKARTWSGRFLALLHSALSEAVILELEE
ncbi:hypothetical protein BDM02DRAFT_3273592 [Thelephora ganbajun]|uniref:Uncharacterized protein n=1 Tax=Thelephora ganbajun TaxID=370292 RepID=A0ACB6YY00_THEGA|nr:hypothetical protein BDM02DRAFT_3273592 [Thelephora ganbajun]